MRLKTTLLLALLMAAAPFAPRATAQKAQELLNVSYDPTRELYGAINPLFEAQWKQDHGAALTLKQSHGGSGKQARSVLDGLEADVVTLALAQDIDVISEKGKLLPQDWQSRLPNNSCPYVSTVVLLVRKGNPKAIADWDDLARPGIQVITPNPKTSGGARWNYLALWSHASRKFGGDEKKTQGFVDSVFRNVPVLDTGARGATNTFAQRGAGDVLIGWENEAWLAKAEFADQGFEIVYPKESILAEPPVAWLDANVKRHGTAEVAEAYLRFLYTPAAQEVIAKHHFRPSDRQVFEKHAKEFGDLKLRTLNEEFGSWAKAHAKHFAEGGTFDHTQVVAGTN
ncbi:MAG TPA: sulfate ABC transporter substrate-binding protein [Planctomycetota bacterium]|nr:sulfate ABC transporter substrate-binding protein [Planctomycetota bacterium]